jgi:hypothetical protein
MGLSWPPRISPATDAVRADPLADLVDQLHQAYRDIDDLREVVAVLQNDRERLEWWFTRVRAAVAGGRTPRVYCSREALDRARQRSGDSRDRTAVEEASSCEP